MSAALVMQMMLVIRKWRILEENVIQLGQYLSQILSCGVENKVEFDPGICDFIHFYHRLSR